MTEFEQTYEWLKDKLNLNKFNVNRRYNIGRNDKNEKK